jgi:hypothetical protein
MTEEVVERCWIDVPLWAKNSEKADPILLKIIRACLPPGQHKLLRAWSFLGRDGGSKIYPDGILKGPQILVWNTFAFNINKWVNINGHNEVFVRRLPKEWKFNLGKMEFLTDLNDPNSIDLLKEYLSSLEEEKRLAVLADVLEKICTHTGLLSASGHSFKDEYERWEKTWDKEKCCYNEFLPLTNENSFKCLEDWRGLAKRILRVL